MPSSPVDPWAYLSDRFGVEKEDLPGMHLTQVSGDYWLVSNMPPDDVTVKTYGVRFLRGRDRGLKPTTYALQLLGNRITRNRVILSDGERDTLLHGEMIAHTCEEPGYVALVHDGQVLGCGYYKDGRVSSRIPKGQATHLRDMLDL